MILLGPVPDSSISELSATTQKMLSLSLFVGSAICLFGSATGSRFFFRNWKRTKSYQYAVVGMPFVATSIMFYGYAVYVHTPNWISAVGATLGPLLGVGGVINSTFVWLESRRIRDKVEAIRSGDD